MIISPLVHFIRHPTPTVGYKRVIGQSLGILTKAPIKYSMHYSLHLDNSISPKNFDWSVIRTY